MNKVQKVREDPSQMSPMLREKHKEALTRKLLEKDPSECLVKPEKSSKSCAWGADCFSLVFHNKVKENYVYCQICNNLITYNSVHGTGSMLRHHCYKKMINVQKDKNSTAKTLNFATHSKALKRPHSQGSPLGDVLQNMSDSLEFQLKGRDNSRLKKDIEDMIARGDPAIDMRPPVNIKSEVWSNGNFKIIYRNGKKMDFVMCLYCSSLITYKSKTGTASLLRHSCIKRMNESAKAGQPTLVQNRSMQEFVAMNEAEHIDDPDASQAPSAPDLSFLSNDNDGDNDQYLSGEFPDEFKEEVSKLFQYCSYKDMQPMSLANKKGFLSFGQYLINIGAEYGKVNIETIIDCKNAHGDNFMNILQKMLKQKFEDHKIALSCDFWTDMNRKMNFFTLYGHYISDMFEIKRANLGTVSFTEEFSAIDFKRLTLSILESYFTAESDAETFLSKTTTVIFDEMNDCFKSFSSISCSCLTLNRIVHQLIKEVDGVRELIPSEVLATDNWLTVWEYLELSEDVTDSPRHEELKGILDPFTKASKSLSCDYKPTINEVYIFRKKIEDHFRSFRSSNAKISDLALNLIKEHFPITSLHKIAVFLDPRFKSLKLMSREDKANVIAMVGKMISEETDNNAIAASDENDVKCGQAGNTSKTNSIIVDGADSSKYLIEYMDIVEEREDTPDEIEMYMNLKFNDIYSANILEFWESRYDLPHLRQLARDILCIPTCGVVSEKIFTEDANLLVKRRLNMEIEDIKQSLYIHENFDMLSNVL